LHGQVRFRRRFRRRFWEALVQSQTRFNRVPEKAAEKVPDKVPEKVGTLWCSARFEGVTDRRFRGRFWRRSGRLWCRARSGLTGFRFRRRFPEKDWAGRLWCSQVRFNRVPEKVPALGFAARFRKICKHKTLRLLGIPPKLIGNINPSRAGGLPAYPKSRNLYWNERPSMAFQMPAFCARRVIKKRLQCFSVSMTRT